MIDLRAIINSSIWAFLLSLLGIGSSYGIKRNDVHEAPNVPYEIKFANITFQLTDATRSIVQTELKNIQADRASLHQQLDKLSLFLPIAEPLLREKAIPEDFKFLMLYNRYQTSIETSTYLENGVFWCLNKEKAEDVSLIVNHQIDERKHLIASTKGAAICLNRNQVLYRNWASTLFSHISDKKILSLLEVKKKWADSPYVLLDSPSYAPVLQFLAYRIAVEREFPLFKPIEQKIVYEYPYSKGKTLNRIAQDLKVEPASLTEYNKWLISESVPDSECKVLVVVPAERYNEVRSFAEISRKTNLPTKDLGFPVLRREDKLVKSKGKGGTFYYINEIEGLQADMCDIPVTMAYKAGISLEKFVNYNDLKETDILSIGQVYYIQPKRSKASVPFHVVREGETLWDISHIYGVRLSNLLSFNRFESVQRLQRGRVIWLQSTRPKNKPIEYIEMPDEFEEAEEVLLSEKTKNVENELSISDGIKTVELQPNSKAIKKTATELNEGLGKSENVKSARKNNSAPVQKEDVNEVDVSTLPLSQEIGKKSQPNGVILKTQDKSISENPSIEEGKSPLPIKKDIRKERNNPVTLPQSTDSEQVNGFQERTEQKVVTPNSQSIPKDKLYSEKVAEKEDEVSFQQHSVKKGETLFRIAVNYDVTVSELWVWNKLTSTIIKEGMILKIKVSK